MVTKSHENGLLWLEVVRNSIVYRDLIKKIYLTMFLEETGLVRLAAGRKRELRRNQSKREDSIEL